MATIAPSASLPAPAALDTTNESTSSTLPRKVDSVDSADSVETVEESAKNEIKDESDSTTAVKLPEPANTLLIAEPEKANVLESINKSIAYPAKCPAMRAMGRQGMLHKSKRHPPYFLPGLASPTDKLMSPATRGVNKLRHKKIDLAGAPCVLENIFMGMAKTNKKE